MHAVDIIGSSSISASTPKTTAALAASAAASELKKKVCTYIDYCMLLIAKVADMILLNQTRYQYFEHNRVVNALRNMVV